MIVGYLPDMPRYIDSVLVDPAGTVKASDLPAPLPYNLTPRDFFRMVEDIHDVLHNVNSVLHQRGYQRMEELLDPAGFSGMISRTVANRLAAASRTLVVNRFHNGYPDLLVEGAYPNNAVQHGEGGLEIKASRYESGWQTHGPRAGWFCVVQFEMDVRTEIALFDREPTRVRAVMVAELVRDDWSWQPAKPGKIRSGTASMKPSGVAKCRQGAVWVDPDYRETSYQLLAKALLDAFRGQAPTLLEQAMRERGEPITADEAAMVLRPFAEISEDLVRKRAKATLTSLVNKGRVKRLGRGGPYELLPAVPTPPEEPEQQPESLGPEMEVTDGLE
jgi:hypothetical protein